MSCAKKQKINDFFKVVSRLSDQIENPTASSVYFLREKSNQSSETKIGVSSVLPQACDSESANTIPF